VINPTLPALDRAYQYRERAAQVASTPASNGIQSPGPAQTEVEPERGRVRAERRMRRKQAANRRSLGAMASDQENANLAGAWGPISDDCYRHALRAFHGDRYRKA
jgi:hypothetical protein